MNKEFKEKYTDLLETLTGEFASLQEQTGDLQGSITFARNELRVLKLEKGDLEKSIKGLKAPIKKQQTAIEVQDKVYQPLLAAYEKKAGEVDYYSKRDAHLRTYRAYEKVRSRLEDLPGAIERGRAKLEELKKSIELKSAEILVDETLKGKLELRLEEISLRLSKITEDIEKKESEDDQKRIAMNDLLKEYAGFNLSF